MALPTIVINGSTGSDSSASGAGPTTAVSGTLAATASSTSVTITDAVDLSGVATDGSAVLWVNTASNRQFSKITAISGSSGSWTVTVADSYGVTASGQSWAIGGKRASLAGSLQLGSDCRSGWTIDVQTDQTLTANFRLQPNGVANQWTTFTCSQTARATISTSTSGVGGLDLQGANNLVVSHLSFKSTSGTPGDGIAPQSATGANYVVIQDCIVDGFRNGIMDHDSGGNVDVNGMIISGCEAKNCTTAGISTWSGAQISDCYCHNNTKGLIVQGTRSKAVSVARSIFDSNTNMGADFAPSGGVGVLVENCVFSNNTAGGGTVSGLNLNAGGAISVVLRNNIFYGNKNYGIGTQGGNMDAYYAANNAFGSNGTSNTQSPATVGINSITLTANPFTSSTNFTPNSTAGGGVLLKGAAASIPNAQI